jgi:hypothetical protein
VYLVQVGWVARFLLTGWGGGKEGGKWKDRLGDTAHGGEAVMDGAPGYLLGAPEQFAFNCLLVYASFWKGLWET